MALLDRAIQQARVYAPREFLFHHLDGPLLRAMTKRYVLMALV
jgi:hypothetical protein